MSDTINPPIEKILEKIANLRELESRPGTPEEAAAAAAAIQRLMFRWNLSQHQIDTAKTGRTNFSRRRVRYSSQGTPSLWRSTLLHVITRCNFCRSIRIIGSNMAEVIGEEHNLRVCFGLYDYLEAEILRLCEEGFRDRQSHSLGRLAYTNSFAHGAVDAIWIRMEEQYRKSTQETSESTALVLVVTDELDKAIEEFFDEKPKKSPVKARTDTQAYLQGQAAGSKINLDRQLQEGD